MGTMQKTNLFPVGFILLFLLTSVVFGQESRNKPFAKLDEQVKKTQGGWNGSKQPLAAIFNAERNKLGTKFDSELLKYLGTNVEKHYWISSFLEAPSYLQGNTALPHLSLLIKQQGLSLCVDKKDDESKHFTVGLSVTAAVLSAQLGLAELAKYHKAVAEKMMKEDEILKASFPAMDEAENNLYDKIKPIPLSHQ